MDNALFQTPVEEQHTVSPQQSKVTSLEDILLLPTQALVKNNQGYTSCHQNPACILPCPGDAAPEGPSEEDSLYPSDKSESPGDDCNRTSSSSGSGHYRNVKRKGITRRKGGGTPLGHGATLGANTFYNKFNLLPLVTGDEATPSSSDKEEDTTITSIIMSQIKAKPKRKWKHSKLFPSNKENSSDSAEELLKSATSKRSPEEARAFTTLSKHIDKWTPKEWAQILGIKWPNKNLRDQKNTNKIRAGTTKAKKGTETQRKEGRCFSCNKQGHFKHECPRRTLSTPATHQKDVQSKDPSARTIWNIDGTHNKAGTITDFVDLQVRAGKRVEDMRFLVTDLGEDEIILGYPWLAAFQPNINWKDAVLDEEMQPLVIKTLGLDISAEVERVKKAWIRRARSMATPGEEVFVTRLDIENLRKTSSAAQMAAKAQPKEEKTWDQIVPRHYHKWKKVFSEEEAKRFPKHQPWDIAIDFTNDAPASLDCKIYPLTNAEQGQLEEYIKDNLEKGYIRPSKSQYSSPFFFVGKKDGKLRPVVDYRKLNSFTVPDRYPLPLIQGLVDKVKDARLFTKIDVRAGYNNIRFREGDESKAAFKTNMGLYEPTVMPFGLRNAPAVFQRMVNTQFADILAKGGVVNYMDDFLIATKKTTHRNIEQGSTRSCNDCRS
jgi:hypothetical protein